MALLAEPMLPLLVALLLLLLVQPVLLTQPLRYSDERVSHESEIRKMTEDRDEDNKGEIRANSLAEWRTEDASREQSVLMKDMPDPHTQEICSEGGTEVW
ncbi:hypothetical protein EYF80_005064 [Liparis tanakae]|uniref:Uncharacterized protein n=1 Tax=Liparis tanakae TaxID=230148 RepID=A0A4Z2J356_9TELE|nr:hypothetical protein EYF80_005064 [Liparis tanakae]